MLSMMLKLETLLRKSEARGAYGFLLCASNAALALFEWPLLLEMSTWTIWDGSWGAASPFACGHIAVVGAVVAVGKRAAVAATSAVSVSSRMNSTLLA